MKIQLRILSAIITLSIFGVSATPLAATAASPQSPTSAASAASLNTQQVPGNPSTTVSVVGGDLLSGQDHYYSVMFRGNGEAIIYAKFVLTNSNEAPIANYSFEMPKVTPSEIVMYQMQLPKTCQNYSYGSYNAKDVCISYRDPDYTGQKYYSSYEDATYKKIEYTKSGNKYSLKLPDPIESNKSGAIIVAYAAKGYVNQFLGLSKFTFETLKVNARIQSVKVAVDVDSDMLLKGKKSTVNYESSSTNQLMSGVDAASPQSLNKVAGQIGYGTSLTKTAKNLAPNESLTVKGEYAGSWYRLYLNSILIFVLIIGGIIGGAILLTRYFTKRHNNSPKPTAPSEQTVSNHPAASKPVINGINMLVSFGSSAGVVGLTFLLEFIGRNMYSNNFAASAIFQILSAIAIILLYILIIAIPAILVGLKYGWKHLIAVLIMDFVWLLIMILLFLVLFQSGLTDNYFQRNDYYAPSTAS